MQAPPEMRSRRKGCHPCTGDNHNLEDQQSDHATTTFQAQRLRRLFALSLTLATVVAELAYAGGPR
jgi:hypothetical protein